MSNSVSTEAVAIVGLAGRFPRARNLDEFWQKLQAGEELVTFFSDEELLSSGIDAQLLGNPAYVKARAMLEDAELFDASFFGFSPREAEILDPQQRLFLECAWEALENAGCVPERYEGSIGVYAGLSMNSYLINNLLTNPDVIASAGGYQLMLANDKDFIATRVSYKLNLRGPSVNIQTACSTSLVAVQVACQALLNYQCDMALTGGVSVSSPRKAGYLYQPGMIMSPDGHCRAFDEKAEGIVPGEGVGVVVLKRLSEALADGDTIHAVIKGSAINNDGAQKVGYTAPSVTGQAEVIALAQSMAGVTPETIGYVEAHGTGTDLGDPIEITALSQAFRTGTQARNFCAIGSVKTNMGHLDAAAGIAGLLKTVLALEHRQIPPSLHFQKPNPNIDFASSPFYVSAALKEWEANGAPRRAGVSSFGIGGTNAHVVVEEAPAQTAGSSDRPGHLVILSAMTTTALENATDALARHLRGHPELDLADVAYTLQVGRKTFGQRRVVVCENLEGAVSVLESRDPRRMMTATQELRGQPVAFMFPGQGAQYVNMARELYSVEPIFRAEVDRCAEILKDHLGLDLRQVLYPEAGGEEEASRQLLQTWLTQSALFVVEYALARWWMALGIQPQGMIGHSIGEYVAACLAGVFSLADALALVAARGRLMQELPGGSMLAVTLDEVETQAYLEDGLALAAVNGPRLCVVSGHAGEIQHLKARLEAGGVACRSVHTSHAFHSQMMEPILERFKQRVAQVQLSPPSLPYLSNLTGAWVSAGQATDPAYWAAHLRSTVRFSQGIAEMSQESGMILLEVGPGQTLSTLARQQLDGRTGRVVLNSLRHPHDPASDHVFLMNALGHLWLAGAGIEWSGLYSGENRRRVPLPTYSFERQRYWVEPPASRSAALPSSGNGRLKSANSGSPLKRADLSDWFCMPSWKRLDLPGSGTHLNRPHEPLNWLIFCDSLGISTGLQERLTQLGHSVTTVQTGERLARINPGTWSLHPADQPGYVTLLQDLRNAGQWPDRIVHLWNVNALSQGSLSPEEIDAIQEPAFYSLLYLAQAVGQLETARRVQIDVVANGIYEVTGEEGLCPAKATLLGPCHVTPQEYPQIACRNIDIVLPDYGINEVLLGQVWGELQAEPDQDTVAYRGSHRWVPTYEELRLTETSGMPSLLRQRGVYLITGGMGGMGLVLAEYLAKAVQARLVLTGRTDLPERGQWNEWMAGHGEEDRVSRKVARLQALEALGAELLVVKADVTDLAEMRVAVTAARARFGAIHGVIHAAGIAGGGIIPLKNRAMADRVLAPKVLGASLLHSALQDADLDFFVLCSSFNSILGGIGQVDYVAANAFLDAFAYARNRLKMGQTIAINWGTWREVGMAVETEVPAHLRQWKEENLRNGIMSAEGQEAFQRVLATSLSQVVISTQDLQALIHQRVKGQIGPIGEDQGRLASADTGRRDASQSLHVRPNLGRAYEAPRSDREHQIAGIWQKLLGIDQIGVHDNFFELGGHSLLATQVISRLKEGFGVDLSLKTIFESPTIADLAAYLETLLWVAESKHATLEIVEGDREEVEF